MIRTLQFNRSSPHASSAGAHRSAGTRPSLWDRIVRRAMRLRRFPALRYLAGLALCISGLGSAPSLLPVPTSTAIILASSMLYFGNSANADRIRIEMDTYEGLPGFLGGSEMWVRNQPGGKLGGDSGDRPWYLYERPPGSAPNFLRVWSDQINRYYNVTGEELRIDNRPYSADERGTNEWNQPFPLFFDIQSDLQNPPSSITSSNNFVRFVLEQGPDLDQGRGKYAWTMNLYTNMGARFADGTTSKAGIWDLSSNSSLSLPNYHLTQTPLNQVYGDLTLTVVPEPSTIGLVLIGVGGAALAAQNRRRKNRENE